MPGLHLCFTHANCICNELVAAANRVCGKVPQITSRMAKLVKREAKILAAKLEPTLALTYEEFLSGYSGRKLTRYQNAVASLRINPVRQGDARISAFVKSEKFDPGAKVNPDPRMIQARNGRYNVELGRYLRPMEKQLYQLRGPTEHRLIAKGLNQRARAQLLLAKWASIPNCVCISLDCSRWDKHIGEELLRAEHLVYKTLNNDPFLAQLLEWQVHNRCWTQGGVFYRTLAKRNSGDMNTALGNCLLMCLLIRVAMREIGVNIWDALDDGDDCLVFIRKEDLEKVMGRLPAIFLEMGHELKVDEPVSDPHDVVFCQTKLVDTADGPLMVRDWKKVLSQGTSGTRHWGDPRIFRDMLWAVGKCELALNRGVPILQAYGEALVRNGSGRAPKQFEGEFEVHYKALHMAKSYGVGWSGVESGEITDEARSSFQRAYGLTSWEQSQIEDTLASWTIEEVNAEDHPLELDSTWDFRPAIGRGVPVV